MPLHVVTSRCWDGYTLGMLRTVASDGEAGRSDASQNSMWLAGLRRRLTRLMTGRRQILGGVGP